MLSIQWSAYANKTGSDFSLAALEISKANVCLTLAQSAFLKITRFVHSSARFVLKNISSKTCTEEVCKQASSRVSIERDRLCPPGCGCLSSMRQRGRGQAQRVFWPSPFPCECPVETPVLRKPREMLLLRRSLYEISASLQNQGPAEELLNNSNRPSGSCNHQLKVEETFRDSPHSPLLIPSPPTLHVSTVTYIP